MRYVVAREGYRIDETKVVREGAFYLKDENEIVPVRDSEGRLIGLADGFRREEDGTITFDVDLTSTAEIDEDQGAVQLNPIGSYLRSDGVTVIISARIREIAFGVPTKMEF